mmetsp:Transcript_87162/g.243959  ORF Transcript_87162/g.243959 Transcript_87162/m.243959 type:complete len:205 (-) Transcript_87162:874-1488(-)
MSHCALLRGPRSAELRGLASCSVPGGRMLVRPSQRAKRSQRAKGGRSGLTSRCRFAGAGAFRWGKLRQSRQLVHAPRQVPHHVLVVGLVRASTDLQQLRIPPQTLDVVFSDVPVAAHHLDRPVRNLLPHGTAIQLHAIGVQAVADGLEVQVLRHVVHIAFAGHVFGVRLGDEPLDLAEAVQLRAEGDSVLGEPVHLLDASTGDA